MPQDSKRSVSLADASLVVALLPVVIAPIARGGVHPSSQAVACALELFALALLAAHHATRRKPVSLSWFIAPLAIAFVSALVHVVPLPHRLRAALAPDGADRVDRAIALLPADAGLLARTVLAFDPPEAALGVMRLVAALALFIVVAQAARRRTPRRLAWRILLVGAIALLTTWVAHSLIDVAGRFENDGAWMNTYMRNTNQAARVFGAFAFLLMGRAMSTRRNLESLAMGAVGIACAVAMLMTLSRGAFLAAAVGGLVLVALVATRKSGAQDSTVPPWAAAVAAVVVAGGAALLVAGRSVVRELATLAPGSLAHSKVFLYEPAWRVIKTHAGVGLGPGAFGLALPSALEIGELDASHYQYTHVENLALQVLVDHGAIVGALLLAAGAIGGLRLAADSGARRQAGALACLAFLVVGELLDFAFQLPAGLLLATLALALAAGAANGGWLRPAPPPTTAATVLVLITITAALAPAALGDARASLDRALHEIQEQSEGQVDARGDTLAAARRALLQRAFARHPSDGQYAYDLAREARHRRDPHEALRFANRALALWPAHRGAHLETARALAAVGHVEQALLEYRVAWRCGPLEQRELLKEIAARFPKREERQRAVSLDDPESIARVCDTLRIEGRLDDAQACFDDVAALPSPQRWGAYAIELALERKDVDGAASRARVAMTGAHPDGAIAPAAARAIAAKDGAKIALDESAGWLSRLADRRALLEWRLQAALGAGADDIVEGALEELRRTARDQASLERVDVLRADALEQRQHLAEAYAIVTRLTERNPGDVDLVVRRARLEIALELVVQAGETIRRAQRVWPNDTRVQALAASAGAPAER